MPRLIDIGIEPYLLASSVEAIVAQRLVRSTCPHCAQPYTPEPEALIEIGDDPNHLAQTYQHGTGCDHCRNSGYHGRSAIHEMLVMDDEVRHLIMERAPGSRIKQLALEHGMESLRDDGRQKARQGITTVDEVLRVTQEDR